MCQIIIIIHENRYKMYFPRNLFMKTQVICKISRICGNANSPQIYISMNNCAKRIRFGRNRNKLDRFSGRSMAPQNREKDRGSVWAIGEARENSARKLGAREGTRRAEWKRRLQSAANLRRRTVPIVRIDGQSGYTLSTAIEISSISI